MKMRQWFLLAALPLFYGCKTAAPSPPSPVAAAVPLIASNPAPYLRVARPTTNVTELQIAVREFVPRGGAQPVIWLAGVSHVGESNYYARLQKLLDAQGLVLYEGVTDRASRAAKRPPVESPEDELGSLQNTMAESLGLAYQLNSIDYDRKHFRNSDLTIEEIAQLMAREGPAGKPGKTAQEFEKLMELMQGDSLIGALVGGILKLIGSNPKLQAMMKLAMIEMLGRFKGDLSQFEGLAPEWQRLMEILLRARNDAVLKDLQTELSQRAPAKSIAIFYGAAHMEDLERRVTERFGYRLGRELWLPAFSVDLEKTQITPAELSFVQTVVDWQMQILEQKAEE